MSKFAKSTAAFRSLSRAMFRGFVRDRAALVFSILIPVLFLVLLGSIYKSASTPRLSVIEIGRVSLLDAARGPQLTKVMTITRGTSLAAALEDVRKGTDDAAVQQRGSSLVVRYIVTPVQPSAANGSTDGAAKERPNFLRSRMRRRFGVCG